MIHTLTRMYSDLLIKHNLISEGDREIHEYGFTALFLFICNYGILFLLAALTGTIIETILFLLMYSLPRNIIGGWHAGTPLLCAIFGIVMWAVGIIFYYFLHLPNEIQLVLSIACAGALSFLVCQKDISAKRKKTGYLLIAILCITSIVSSVYGFKFSSLILYALLCNFLMNIPRNS